MNEWLFFSPDFQNYLRTQTGNTTTINIIICTVDYLLRLQVRMWGRPSMTWVRDWGASVGPALPHTLSAHQESISDFYWYYSGKDVIEEQGKRNFSKAMSVAKQVFNSLTEYIQVRSSRRGREGQSRIPRPAWRSRSALSRSTLPPRPQGPCTGNQQSLAHSRLWDAVVGFLHVFAHMMMKLAQVRGPSTLHPTASGHPQLARFQVLPHRSVSYPSAPGMFQTGFLPVA